MRSLAPLMSAFVQLSLSSAEAMDEAALQRAKTLLQNILNGWKDDFATVIAEEEKAKALFADERARIEAVINGLET